MRRMPNDRRFTLITPLGEDVLLLKSMNGHETLGRPFRYELELLSEQASIDPDELVGEPMTIKALLPEGGERFFSGVVTSFAEAGGAGRYARFHAVLEPWLSLLDLTSDCRIFQAKPVPEIAKTIFRDAGFSDFEERIYESYAEWEYIVQYRESAFAFVSRLLEQEGMYYHFRHESQRHHLVLADSPSSHEPAPGYEELPFYPPSTSERREGEHITSFHMVRQIQPGALSLTDFDFKRPKVSLMSKVSDPNAHAHADFEVYDYPGEFLDAGAGKGYAKRRLEELHAGYERFEGTGNAVGVGVGQLFKLTNHPVEAHNKEFLVVAAHYSLVVNGYESGAGLDEDFDWTFTAIDARRQYRAPATTPKPLIRGPQTAIVVGPSGEEIWVDEFGRIKVQFHWDRVGGMNENSSCWVRVSQAWAGAGFGAAMWPRLGQEVVVEFLEGDPDRPLVTGRVYNGDNMPPYKLPDNKTQSGVKTRSSKGGGADNCNEIRLEDKKGSELFYVQAEKDLETLVKNDERRNVGANRNKSVAKNETCSVGEDRTASVGKNENQSVGQNRTESIGADQSTTVGGNQNESVGSNNALTVGAHNTITVAGSNTVAVGADDALTVGGASLIAVGGKRSATVGGDASSTVGGNYSVSVSKDESRTVAGKQNVKVAKDGLIDVGKKFLITVGDQLTIKVGKASITMKKDGTITIDGKDIKLNGSGKIDIKASSDVKIKGSKVAQN